MPRALEFLIIAYHENDSFRHFFFQIWINALLASQKTLSWLARELIKWRTSTCPVASKTLGHWPSQIGLPGLPGRLACLAIYPACHAGDWLATYQVAYQTVAHLGSSAYLSAYLSGLPGRMLSWLARELIKWRTSTCGPAERIELTKWRPILDAAW